MNIQINAVGFTAAAPLVDFINKKIEKMDTFYDRITGAEVYLKLGKGDSNRFQKKYIEVKLDVPGNIIFVKEEGSTFEEATDIAVEVLSRQVKKHKQKSSGSKHAPPLVALDPVLDDGGIEE